MKKTIIALATGVALLGSALPALAETAAVEAEMIGQLQRGAQGERVKLLQALLAADPDLYPEAIISGFYGELTARAVARFQTKHRLEAVGIVGPRTLEKLRMRLASSTDLGIEDADGVRRPCAIVPPGHLIAPGWLKRMNGVMPIVPPCQKLPPGIELKLRGSATTTQPVATTTPTADVFAPRISLVKASNISTTSATVSWRTNEAATGKVFYATTTPVDLSSAASVESSTFTSRQRADLTGLSPATIHYFVVEATDAVDNSSTSRESTLRTRAR